MTFILKLESLDDEPEEKEFQTQEEAIEYAKTWFLEGYENETISDEWRAVVLEDIPELVANLRAGRRFYCSRFYEEITLHQR